MRQLFDILKAKETEIYSPRFFIIVSRQMWYFLHTRCNAQETRSVKVHIYRHISTVHYYAPRIDDAFMVIFREFWSQNTVLV